MAVIAAALLAPVLLGLAAPLAADEQCLLQRDRTTAQKGRALDESRVRVAPGPAETGDAALSGEAAPEPSDTPVAGMEPLYTSEIMGLLSWADAPTLVGRLRRLVAHLGIPAHLSRLRPLLQLHPASDRFGERAPRPRESGGFGALAVPEPQEVTLMERALGGASVVVLTLVVAFLYDRFKVRENRVQGAAEEAERDKLDFGFKYRWFGCLDDPCICLFTCFCSSVRWADTVGMAGLLGFWPALALLCGLEFLNVLLLGTVWVGMLILQVVMRQQLRKKFQMPAGGCGTVTEDVLLYCCCWCCAVCQEARQLEDAYRTGHRVALEAEQPQARAES